MRKDKRTTLSLAKVVWDIAEEMMKAKGFNDNFSAYVGDLIRRDKENAMRVFNSSTTSASQSSIPPKKK